MIGKDVKISCFWEEKAMKEFTISSFLSWMKRLSHSRHERYEKGMTEYDGWRDACRDEIKKNIGGIR